MLQYADREDEVRLDRIFHALSDPGRRSMVERLSRGSASVSELASSVPMTLTAVVQHVHVLEGSGLVTSEKRGRVRTCAMHGETLRRAEEWMLERRRLWERRLDRLGEVLSTNDDEEGRAR